MNGTVKRHNKSFRILHEKFDTTSAAARRRASRFANAKNSLTPKVDKYAIFQTQFLNMIEENEEIGSNLNNVGTVDLLPWTVYELFKNINESDYVLLGLRFANDNISNNNNNISHINGGINSSGSINAGIIIDRIPKHRPQDLILTSLPVPPTTIRPSTTLQDSKSNEDDLTVMLEKILLLSNFIRDHQMYRGAAQVSTVIDYFLRLQLKISEYLIADLPGYPISSGLTTISSTVSRNRKKPRSYSERLKGKFGRFRGNLSGKRVNFSGRTVISPDPNLAIDQVGVPRRMAMMLTFSERVTKHNINKLRQLIKNGAHRHPGAISVIRPCIKDIDLIYGVDNKGNIDETGYWAELSNSKYNKYKRDLDGSQSNLINTTEKKLLRVFRNYQARCQIAKELKYGDIVERHLMDNDILLFNRQPSLHRVSIMSHRAKIVPHRTLRFNPCVCNPYNADFDGDEMNIHAPQTLMACADAKILMNVKQNFSAPKAAEPLVVPLQDFITSIYTLTNKNVFLTKMEITQLACYMGDGIDTIELPMPAILKPIQLWTGKQVFSLILRPNSKKTMVGNEGGCGNTAGTRITEWPLLNLSCKARNCRLEHPMDPWDGYVVINNSELMCGNICKGTLGSSLNGLFFRLIKDFGCDMTGKIMYRLAKIASRYLQLRGFSIGMSDVTPTKKLLIEKNKLLNKGYNDCDQFLNSWKKGTLIPQPGCTLLETLEAVMNNRLSQIREDAGKKCTQILPYDNNAPLIMAECGSKGSKINISQMIACVGQQTVGGSRVVEHFVNRTLPHFNLNEKTASAKGFVANSFFSGLTATEFFFHTMGGREGLVDTAVKTAETGYMQRRLMKNIEDVSVSYDYTVRNTQQTIIQFLFGHDGIDPMHKETDNIVNFNVLLNNIRSKRGVSNYNGNINMNDDNEKENKILQPQEMIDFSKKMIFDKHFVSKELKFLRDQVEYPDKKCEEKFESDLYNFIKILCDNGKSFIEFMKNEELTNKKTLDSTINHWYYQLYGLKLYELKLFIEQATNIYVSCFMEPGSAVGGLAATSMGEPATQMTLKTFHFAGVASMNITQGVPRIREIINATPNIKTPIITCHLDNNDCERVARIVKSRIDITKFGQICQYIEQKIKYDKCYVQCKLNLTLISKLHLQMTVDEIAYKIELNIKKLMPKIMGKVQKSDNITIYTIGDKYIRIEPDCRYYSEKVLNILLHSISVNVQNIVVKGIESVSRAVVKKDNQDLDIQTILKHKLGKGNKLCYNGSTECTIEHINNLGSRINGINGINDDDDVTIDVSIEKEGELDYIENVPLSKLERVTYELLVEGSGLMKVMNVAGVNGLFTVSNDILEVCRTLGIEAANQCIVNEVNKTYSSHGLSVDLRHLMLIGDLMTHNGKVLGFTRHGMGKESPSVIAMASFEETLKHLFHAAIEGEENYIRGVSDSIVMGLPIPIGTGSLKVLRDVPIKPLKVIQEHEIENKNDKNNKNKDKKNNDKSEIDIENDDDNEDDAKKDEDENDNEISDIQSDRDGRFCDNDTCLPTRPQLILGQCSFTDMYER